jgi:HK97 family phage major capsid protein
METQVLEAKLGEILTQIKDHKAKCDERDAKFIEKLDALQKQADALDIKIAERHTAVPETKSLEDTLKEDKNLTHFLDVKQGTVKFTISGKHYQNWLEQKTTIDRPTVGFPTPGVLQIERTPGIVLEARQTLTMRNILSARPTSLGMIDFVKVNSAQAAASMQTEASAKVENALTFTTGSQKVETVASWIPATRQVLDDWSELMGAIDNALRYAVNQREDIELLFGNNVSPDLNGLYTAATAYDTSMLTALLGWNKADVISGAIQQIQIAKEIQPTFVVLHPTDYWQIIRTKDLNKDYLFGRNGMVDPFWGLTPFVTTFMTAGQFLIGSGSPVAAEIRDRMSMEVAISTEHASYFIQNMVAIRAEKRLALVIYRPGSFIKGTFNTSP